MRESEGRYAGRVALITGLLVNNAGIEGAVASPSTAA